MSEDVEFALVTDAEFRAAAHRIVEERLRGLASDGGDWPRLPREGGKGLVQRDAERTGAFVEVVVWVPNGWATKKSVEDERAAMELARSLSVLAEGGA